LVSYFSTTKTNEYKRRRSYTKKKKEGGGGGRENEWFTTINHSRSWFGSLSFQLDLFCFNPLYILLEAMASNINYAAVVVIERTRGKNDNGL